MRQNFWGWMGRLGRELARERQLMLTVCALAVFIALLVCCLSGCTATPNAAESELRRKLSGK